MATIKEEIKIWERVNNPNVVKIFELFDDPRINDIYLLMECAEFGQIQSDQEDGNKVSFEYSQEVLQIAATKAARIWPTRLAHDGVDGDIEMAARWIFYQVAEGMRHLHDDCRIAHRDLKHQNILVGRVNADPRNEAERQPTVKVCDFTTAVIIPEGEEENFEVSIKAGTIVFNSPEQFTEGSFLPKPLDIWAYGISLYVYLTNSLPFIDYEDDNKQLNNFEAILEKVDIKEEITKVYKAKKFSDELIDLQLQLLNRNPKERPQFKDILQHAWYSERVEEVFDEDKKEE